MFDCLLLKQSNSKLSWSSVVRSSETMSLQDPRGTSGGHPGLLQNDSQLGHWANSKRSPGPSRAQEADHGHLQEPQQVKSDRRRTTTVSSKLSLLFVTFAVVVLMRQWNLPHSAGPGGLPQVPGPATPTRNGSWSETCENHCWHFTRWYKLATKIHLRVIGLFLSTLYLLGSDVFWLGKSVSPPQTGASHQAALLHRGQGWVFQIFDLFISSFELFCLMWTFSRCLLVFSGQELHFWVPRAGRWSQEIAHTNCHLWGRSLNPSPPHWGGHESNLPSVWQTSHWSRPPDPKPGLFNETVFDAFANKNDPVQREIFIYWHVCDGVAFT